MGLLPLRPRHSLRLLSPPGASMLQLSLDSPAKPFTLPGMAIEEGKS